MKRRGDCLSKYNIFYFNYRIDDYRLKRTQSGNVLFIILLAIALIGALTAAIQSTSRPEGSSIDNETLVIRASEIQRYAAELERAVVFILQDGKSEDEIRFAHPLANSDYGDLSADADPSDQVFSPSGGGATYRSPPNGINDGSAWEFFAGTHLPGVGSDRPELVAVLPNVTEQFCDKINELNDQDGNPEDTGAGAASGSDPGDCVFVDSLGRFDDGRQYYDSPASTPNTMDETTFTQDPNTSAARPAMQACVTCERDSARHFYHVLLAR